MASINKHERFYSPQGCRGVHGATVEGFGQTEMIDQMRAEIQGLKRLLRNEYMISETRQKALERQETDVTQQDLLLYKQKSADAELRISSLVLEVSDLKSSLVESQRQLKNMESLKEEYHQEADAVKNVVKRLQLRYENEGACGIRSCDSASDCIRELWECEDNRQKALSAEIGHLRETNDRINITKNVILEKCEQLEKENQILREEVRIKNKIIEEERSKDIQNVDRAPLEEKSTSPDCEREKVTANEVSTVLQEYCSPTSRPEESKKWEAIDTLSSQATTVEQHAEITPRFEVKGTTKARGRKMPHTKIDPLTSNENQGTNATSRDSNSLTESDSPSSGQKLNNQERSWLGAAWRVFSGDKTRPVGKDAGPPSTQIDVSQSTDGSFTEKKREARPKRQVGNRDDHSTMIQETKSALATGKKTAHKAVQNKKELTTQKTTKALKNRQ